MLPEVDRCAVLVGVGGSAGGLAPLRRLLEGLAGAANVCGVILLHGSADATVALADVLGSKFANWVRTAQDGDALRPGHFYIVPPQRLGEIEDGVLRLRAPQTASERRKPIDGLFRSIAEHAGDRSVGILLSGEASDGVLALAAILQAGGLSLVQDPQTASHRTLPEAAIDMGYADSVLSPEAIAARVLELARDLEARAAGGGGRSLGDDEIAEVCDLLHERTGLDFKHYKTNTLRRRMLRRMTAMRCASAADYLMHIREDPDEPRLMLRDLLVGVTAFFRDADAYAFLAEQVLRPLMLGRGVEQTIRLWVPGCSTGQEAYSLAMLAQEIAGDRDARVQIFATDLDERAIAVARRGVYPASIADEVGAERLVRFFERASRRYQVSKDLRRLVTFSTHNLISDPPFSRMDVISCRNLLIYLGPHLQAKLMSVFHYALRENGYLFLGSSEAVGEHSELFRVVDAKFRIAQRKPSLLAEPVGGRATPPSQAWMPPARATPIEDLGAITQRIVLDEFAPPYAVANEAGQIVYLSNGASDYLAPSEGQFVNNVIRMARPAIRPALRAAWQRALRDRRTAVVEAVNIENARERQRLRITVQPMPDLGFDSGLLMVVFQDQGSITVDQALVTGPNDAERAVDRLEAELIRTREDLERSIQDLEAANEELKSSNEELLSMNEELQSYNEELKSSKDEVDAARAATEAVNTDLENLLRSTGIATIFLDIETRLRRFTPAATELYNITSADIGRPLAHYTHAFRTLPPLPSLEEVSRANGSIEDEAGLASGRTMLRRVTLYQDSANAPTGIVVTFVDITEQKQVQERLRQAEAQANARLAELEAIYARAPVGLSLLDRDLRYVRINEALAEMNGMNAEAHLGRSVREVVPALADEVEPVFRRILETGETVGPFELEGETSKAPGERRTWIETWAPVKEADGTITGVSLSVIEVTEQKRYEHALAESEARLRRVLDNLFAFVGVLTPEGVLIEVNEAPLRAAGLDRAQVVGKPFVECYWWNFSNRSRVKLAEAIRRAAGGELVRYDTEVRVRDGAFLTIDFQLAPLRDGDGRVIELIPSGVDITDRKRAEQAVAESEERLRLAVIGAGMGTWDADLATGQAVLSAASFEMLDHPRPEGDYAGASLSLWLDRVHPEDRPAVEAAIEEGRHDRDLCTVEHRVLRPNTAEVRWLSALGRFVADGSGEASRFIGVFFDVSERKRAEAQERLLIRELNHRVKNTLATIQALATHTLRHSESLGAFRESFLGRLSAVALAHEILTDTNWRSVELAQLIERQVGPYAPLDGTRVRVTGDRVALDSKQAQMLGLVLHELATNAIKYGALSVETGGIDISWTLGPADRLTLRWIEAGGPKVIPPQRRGFGTQLIELSLKHSLRGDVSLDYDPSGLRVTFERMVVNTTDET